MINPISALLYLLMKRSFEKDPKEIELFNKVENELDMADSVNFERARQRARVLFPIDLIEKDETAFLQSVDKISEFRDLLNLESEKSIVEKYNLTQKQFKIIKEKRFIRKAKKIKDKIV